MADVYDQKLFVSILSRFAQVLVDPYEVTTALTELAWSVTELLELASAGVTLSVDGRLEFAAAAGETIIELERHQEQIQAGPCREAFDSNLVVTVADVRESGDRWPGYADRARRAGIAAVAAIPMRLAAEPIGAMDLYSEQPRHWSADDLAAASVLADIATGYVVNSSLLRQRETLAEQLEFALRTRLVIEQAKGMIAAQRHVPIERAFELIRTHARNNNAKVAAVARAIVELGMTL